MRADRIRTRAGHFWREWPVLLLLAAVLLPAACVLWLMNRAMGDQRLAVRQKMADAYRSQLTLVRERLDSEWAAKSAALDASGRAGSGMADGMILLDPAGLPVYPALVRLPQPDTTAMQPEWVRARQLEENDLPGAASAYAALGRSARDPSIAARAFQAAVRCLMQVNQREAAASLVMERFAGRRFEQASDLQGRLIAADELLLAIQVLRPADARRLTAAKRLRELLLDYENPGLPSTQRLFLMREMQSLSLPSNLIRFPTLEAEELSARLLDAEPKIRADAVLRLSALSGVWKLGLASGRVIAIYRTETARAQMRGFLSRLGRQADVRAEIAAPGEPIASDTAIQSVPAGARLPGWQLALVRTGPDPLDAVARKERDLYVWIGLLMTGAMVSLALIAARGVTRSLRLAGMRTDLVATVSHELKTPVSSMRLLVDTLLDDPVLDPRKTREYLQLIAREDVRLSQLIANFLAFSRMERNKYAFEFTSARVEDVVRAAVEAAGERFEQPDCKLLVEVAPHLPEIRADEGALVTALVNLLDNAYKYTSGEKEIALRAFSKNGSVCFEVSDNGVGIAPRDVKKIFRKFYQADRRLSRTGGGCGLGLAIVRFLVEAHGGTVRVSSQPGKGSTFTVALGAPA